MYCAFLVKSFLKWCVGLTVITGKKYYRRNNCFVKEMICNNFYVHNEGAVK